jgi:hypothetical protein
MAEAVGPRPEEKTVFPPIMLANSAGETSPPDLGKAEYARPDRSKVG